MMTFSAIWTISGEAPTDAPGIMPPSSVMAVASMTARSNFLFGLFLVYQPYIETQFKTGSFSGSLGAGIVTYIDEIGRKHAQVLIKKFDATVVDAPGNIFADLVRAASFDHIQPGPTILGFCTR
jgi:hypothetical protein